MRFVFGDCTLDTERYELRRAGQVVALEPRTFRVLVYLLRHAGRAVTKQELVQACWPGPSSEAISQEYALRNCLMKIRRAVGHAGTPQTVIETVRGYGYRVTAAVTVLLPEALTAGTVPPDHANVSTPPDSSMPSQLLPGRRQLTVLRCALVEEPAWVRRDPEDVRMVLQAFYTTCEEVIQHCDGYIAQYDSAGLLVYFGYPTADEGAAPRAVRAGLMLLNALGRLKVQVAADTPMRLAVRLGIHTGLVVVDTVGVGGGRTWWRWGTRSRRQPGSRRGRLPTQWWSVRRPGTWCRATLQATSWGQRPSRTWMCQCRHIRCWARVGRRVAWRWRPRMG